MEKKTHFKMYKDGRIWVVAGITTMATSLMLFSTAAFGTRAMAAETATTESDVSTVTTATNTGQTVTLGQPTTTDSNSGESLSGTPSADGTSDSSSTTGETPQADTTVGNSTTNSPQSDTTGQANPTTTAGTTTDTTSTTSETTTPESATTPVTPTARTAALAAPEPVAADTSATDSTPTGSISTTAPDASDLTGVIKATDKFNVSKVDELQWSYQHKDLSQVQGQGAWQGADYAAQIASDASGVDPETNQLYLDEWMPDEAFQYFLWNNNFQDQYSDFNTFRATVTKDALSQLTAIQTTDAKQHEGTYNDFTTLTNYTSLMSTQTLEGLQYATNLTTIELIPSTSINDEIWSDTHIQSANLWDISALAPLTKLQTVTITKFAVTDISALANKPELSSLNLSYNQISDISPLATDPKLDISKAALDHQHLLLAPITLKTGTASYTTPSFIIKDLQANNVPITAFDPTSNKYPTLFPSTADGGNLDAITLAWSQMLSDTPENYGSFTTTWKDANSNYEGWIIQPYTFQDAVGNVTINFQLLQADGQQLSLYPTSVLAGTVGSTFDVNHSTAISTALQSIMGDKGLTFSGLILTGTGKYSDYAANNGLAQGVGTTGTYTDDPQTLTLLFLKQWQVQVNYGVIQPDGTTVTSIMTSDGQPLQQQINGDLSTPISLYGDNGIVANLPGYIYAGVQTRTDTTNWTPLATDATEIPFIDGNQGVLVLYRVAQSATVTYQDQTTGQVLKTVTPTDDASLTGIAGQTSTYNSHDQIAAYEQQGYRLVSDGTLTADGKPAIVFSDTGQPTNFVVTLAHTYNASAVTPVTATITYVDQAGQPVATPNVQTRSFVTVTDNTVADDSGTTYYFNGPATQAPTLTTDGHPSDSGWVAGNTAAFTTVPNPVVSSYRVVATSDPTGNLTQVTPTAVTPTSPNSTYQVTYGLTQSQLTIKYVDGNGQPISDPITQNGDQGTAFTVTAPTIPGYRLVDPQQQTVAGTYHGDDMTLTLTYEKQPTTPTTTEPGQVTPPTVTPTDPSNPIPPATTPSTNETPTVVQPAQPTETIVATPSNATTQPTPETADQSVTTAKTAPTTVVANAQPENSVAQPAVTANSTANGQGTQQPITTAARLPQTSDTTSSWWTALGAGLMTLVSGLGLSVSSQRKRRER